MQIPLQNALLFFSLFCLKSCPTIDAGGNLCPFACECDSSKQKDVTTKMKCSSNHWSESDLRNISIFFVPDQIQHLDLSRNILTALQDYFLNAPLLRKLNLSDNKIRIIENLAFANLTGLQILDLSSNYLHYINRKTLSSLNILEKLKIRHNQFQTLEPSTFLSLTKLKALDLSENLWRCDCDLLWLAEWVRVSSVKIQPSPKCDSPETLAGSPLKRLNLECLQPDSLELDPSHDQVVFAGDSLNLRCRSGGGAKRVRWESPTSEAGAALTEVVEQERTLSEHGLVETSLRIEHLATVHSGNWVCQQMAPGNKSATVSVLVISSDTRYCPDAVSRDNKGVYFWPRTVVGNLVELPCAGERIGGGVTATRFCSLQAHWTRLNTSLCPYMSETTKILEQFARDNLSAPGELILDKTKRLWNLTFSPELFADPMDVVFLSRTVDLYSRHIDGSHEMAVLIVDIVAAMQRLPRLTLHSAQLIDKACSRFLKALQTVAKEQPSLQVHGSAIALQEFTLTPDSFYGMACMWGRGSRQFLCAPKLQAVLPGREIEAAVELPRSLFSGLDPIAYQLLITMFTNGNLFPNSTGQIASVVVGINIVDFDGKNLSEPIMVMLRVVPGFTATPVWWDGEKWNQQGCQLSHFMRDLQVFHCTTLGYYSTLHNGGVIKRGLQWSISEAAMYSGSMVLLLCLTISSITYLMSLQQIQMPRRGKHALINTWLAILILCFIFTFGGTETENSQMCQIVGLALHYFSLCALLWLAVAANHMYKRLSRPTDRPQEELPPGPQPQKPILGVYLVGWGIGLIVCGISGAVHLKDYAQPDFCFLGPGPALSAVIVPTVVLVLLLLALYALSLCAIRGSDVNGQLSEGTQGTEHVDLELLEDGACAEHRSARSVPSDSDDTEDPEHSPLVQLKAQVIVLSMLVLTWLSAALATTAGVEPLVQWQEPLASSLYCLFAFLLGVFILYFYCVARSDVRAGWGSWRRILVRRRRCCRTRSISDTNASLPLQTAPTQVVSNGPPSIQSSSSHRTRAVSDLNNCERKPASSVNLVAMHRQIYRSNNSMPTYQEIAGQDFADAFYNPRQSIVAKKFFKKQRRTKRNELGLRRRGDGRNSEGELPQNCRTWRPSAESAVFLSSDMESEKLSPSIFGYGSKVNNTNIHVVENTRRRDAPSPKDPNVLSEEEEEEKGGSKVLLARLVIGAEGETQVLGRVDEEPIAPDCRSVELQCSLGDTDDSFTQKLDSLQLHSDHSCSESLVSPPHYVTVVDPKYGVVKMTMSDYQEQAHRVSLASPTSDRHHSLPPTPEEGEDGEETAPKESNDAQSSPTTLSRIPLNSDSLSQTRPNNLNVFSLNCFALRRGIPQRRSLPPSPESLGSQRHFSDRRSLPPSPVMQVASFSPGSSISDLPPPPSSIAGLSEQQQPSSPVSSDLNLCGAFSDASPKTDQIVRSRTTEFEATSNSLPSMRQSLSADVEQWQRPRSPTSPDRTNVNLRRHAVPSRRLSLSASPNKYQDESKKETSV